MLHHALYCRSRQQLLYYPPAHHKAVSGAEGVRQEGIKESAVLMLY